MKNKMVLEIFFALILILFLSGCSTVQKNSDLNYFAYRDDLNKNLEIIDTERIDSSGRNVTVETVIVESKIIPPKAILLLLRGRGGRYILSENSGDVFIKYATNYSARSIDDFCENGFAVATPDIPSSQANIPIRADFRTSSEHAHDLKKIISFMIKRHPDLPVWVLGSGAGGFSAINCTISNADQVDGLILVSPMHKIKSWHAGADDPKKYSEGMLNLDLEKITKPTILVGHSKDKSGVSGTKAVRLIEDQLINSPHIETMIFHGGKQPFYNKRQQWHRMCNFYRIEDKVAKDIAKAVGTL